MSGFFRHRPRDDEMRNFLIDAVEYLSSFTDGNIEVPVSIIRAMNDVERIAQIEESALSPEKQDVHPHLSPANRPPGRREWLTPHPLPSSKTPSATTPSARCSTRSSRTSWPAATRWRSCPPAAASRSVTRSRALLFDGLTVVVSPLIALMKDQVEQLRAAGVPALFLNSSLQPDEYRQNMAWVRDGSVRLLYVAPRRS